MRAVQPEMFIVCCTRVAHAVERFATPLLVVWSRASRALLVCASRFAAGSARGAVTHCAARSSSGLGRSLRLCGRPVNYRLERWRACLLGRSVRFELSLGVSPVPGIFAQLHGTATAPAFASVRCVARFVVSSVAAYWSCKRGADMWMLCCLSCASQVLAADRSICATPQIRSGHGSSASQARGWRV